MQIDANHDCSQEIIQMFLKKYIDACDYCHTEPNVKIPMGIQIKHSLM